MPSMRYILKKIIKFILSALQVQLFLSSISLLIIAHWGLTLSYIAPISNLIFSPFLTVFLLFSSLIFFLELISFPNAWLLYLLELLTDTWSKIMSTADKSWTLSVSKPPLLFTVVALAIIFGILQSRHLTHPIRRIIAFTMLLITLILYLRYMQPPHYAVHTFTLGTKDLTVIATKKSLSLIDQGALSHVSCTRGWLEFTLLPFLRQEYGNDVIAHLITLRPTIKSLFILSELYDLVVIKNIYIPFWQGETSYRFIKSFMGLQEKTKKQGVFRRIGKKNIHISLDACSSLEIIPLKQTVHYQSLHIQSAYIRCTLASHAISIMPEPAEEIIPT